MPGNGPCKHKGCCRESRGGRCCGYCWRHFKEHHPELAATYHGVVRAGAATCDNCGPKILAQTTDTMTGLRLCRKCARARSIRATACVLCHTEKEVLEQPCATLKCSNVCVLCAACATRPLSFHCQVCYERGCPKNCLQCGEALRQNLGKSSKKHDRICRRCENERYHLPGHCCICKQRFMADEEPSSCPCSCNYCACSSTPQLVTACSFCRQVMGTSISPACIRRHVVQKPSTPNARCPQCKERPLWSKCGTCVPCASLGARGRRGHALLEEASAHLQRCAAAALPQEMPPAMNLSCISRSRAPTFPVTTPRPNGSHHTIAAYVWSPSMGTHGRKACRII